MRLHLIFMGTVYYLQVSQVQNLTKSILKLSIMVLFTHLKIILLRYFKFLIFNNMQYPNRSLVCIWIACLVCVSVFGV